MGRPRRCRGLRSFLPSPYGPNSCSQLGSLPRPRPINAPGGAQLGGGEGKGVPPPPAFVPRAPGPPSSPRPPRPAGTRRCGAGCGPSEGVTSRRGGAARGRSSSELAAAWPHASRRPRSRRRCHRGCPQPPGSRADSAQAGEEGPLPGEGGAGPSPGRGLRKQWGRGWKPHQARSSLGPAPQQ